MLKKIDRNIKRNSDQTNSYIGYIAPKQIQCLKASFVSKIEQVPNSDTIVPKFKLVPHPKRGFYCRSSRGLYNIFHLLSGKT